MKRETTQTTKMLMLYLMEKLHRPVGVWIENETMYVEVLAALSEQYEEDFYIREYDYFKVYGPKTSADDVSLALKYIIELLTPQEAIDEWSSHASRVRTEV